MICPCCLNKLQHIDTVHDSGDIIDYYVCTECGCEVETGFDYCFATDKKVKLIYSQLEDYIKTLSKKYQIKIDSSFNLFTGDIYVTIGECKYLFNYINNSLDYMKQTIIEEIYNCLSEEE